MPRINHLTDIETGVHIIRFSPVDFLESDSVHELRRRIGELAARDGAIRVVLDLEQVVLLSSEAIGMIVVISNSIRPQGGRIHLANISDETCTVFEMLKLQEIIAVFDSTQGAIDAFENDSGDLRSAI